MEFTLFSIEHVCRFYYQQGSFVDNYMKNLKLSVRLFKPLTFKEVEKVIKEVSDNKENPQLILLDDIRYNAHIFSEENLERLPRFIIRIFIKKDNSYFNLKFVRHFPD